MPILNRAGQVKTRSVFIYSRRTKLKTKDIAKIRICSVVWVCVDKNILPDDVTVLPLLHYVFYIRFRTSSVRLFSTFYFFENFIEIFWNWRKNHLKKSEKNSDTTETRDKICYANCYRPSIREALGTLGQPMRHRKS